MKMLVFVHHCSSPLLARRGLQYRKPPSQMSTPPHYNLEADPYLYSSLSPFNPRPGAQCFHLTQNKPVKQQTGGSDITLVEAYWCAEVLSLLPADVSPIQCLTSIVASPGLEGHWHCCQQIKNRKQQRCQVAVQTKKAMLQLPSVNLWICQFPCTFKQCIDPFLDKTICAC